MQRRVRTMCPEYDDFSRGLMYFTFDINSSRDKSLSKSKLTFEQRSILCAGVIIWIRPI